MKSLLTFSIATLLMSTACFADAPAADAVISIWPSDPPAWDAPTEPEADTSGEDGRQVAGERVIRLGNVATPQLHVYRPVGIDSGTAVVICPGGGYSILAWDLEGTEIAERFSKIGVTALVLKYRVPTRQAETNWLAPVQDVQRSIGLVRSGAIDGVQASRVGVLGFSAGGNASAHAALAKKRHYDAIDGAEDTKFTPDYAVLVYPAWLVKDDNPGQLIDTLEVTPQSPPMFFAHASDDRINAMSSVTMYSELKKHQIPGSLHVFASGGHGFGSRVAGAPTDAWFELCHQWMNSQGWLKP
ncbi:Acetylxylan esterase precursor [Rubripirellula lacrimiformis]|uniref:Acetylxylan esterase n=1 Tax=Rubripirellula lacrimiformis TaxID=1930273 RepID=A0A517NG86_9BACT|nr:alpha/beta hydrolase [Rubripirellula lacrimiformis]QDT06142.1 Acetylxylan esterase precursor [Rubripirellula lacrimiformis]